MRWLLLAALAVLLSTSATAQAPVPGGHEAFTYLFDGTKWVPAASGGAAGGPGTGGTLVTPAPKTIVTLDAKSVVTGGTAVTALVAGNRTAGGFVQNPPNATSNLCVNEIGAAGTASSGDTVCVVPGQGYVITASAGAVTINAADTGHAYAGYGLK